jgi:general secretion pathway protein D
VLGSIPIIGLAFKTRSNTVEKNNLMIFLRPKILRDQAQAAYETDLKYNYMQDQQKTFDHREVPPLIIGEHQPRLPPLPPAPPPGTEAAPASPEEKERTTEDQRRQEDSLYRRSLTPQTQPAPPANAAPAAPASPQSNSAPPAPVPQATTPPVTSTPQDGGQR